MLLAAPFLEWSITVRSFISTLTLLSGTTWDASFFLFFLIPEILAFTWLAPRLLFLYSLCYPRFQIEPHCIQHIETQFINAWIHILGLSLRFQTCLSPTIWHIHWICSKDSTLASLLKAKGVSNALKNHPQELYLFF